MRIIEPTMTDVHLLIPQIRQMVAEYKGHLKPNPMTCVRACFRAAETDKCLLMFMLDDEDKLTGYFMGGLTIEMFSGRTIASQIGLMILPEYTGHVYEFFEAFEAWAKRNRASRIYVHFSGASTRRTRVMRHKQFVPAETHYLKEV